MASPETETKIWMAFRQRLDDLPYSFVWPGEVEMPIDEHIRVSQIKGSPRNDDLAGAKPLLPRTLQLMLHSPIPVAYEVTQEKGAQIATKFSQGHLSEMKFDGVRVVVTEPPFVVDGYRDKQWWVTPVRIRVNCHI